MLLGLTLGAVGLVMVLLAPASPMPFATPWVVLSVAVLFAGAESTQIHVEIRRQTFSMSLSELPLVLGLFLLPPVPLLLARLTGAGAVFLLRRTARGKAAFNAGLFTAEVGAIALLFHLLHAGTGLSPRDWLVAYASAALVDVLGSTAIAVAMRRVFGERLALGRVLPLIALAGAFNTTLALVTLLVLHTSVAAAALLAVLSVAAMLGYRAYHRLLRRHADLGQLFAFTQTVGTAQTSDAVIAKLLVHARELLHAETAVLRPAAELPLPGGARAAPEAQVVARDTRDPVLRSWLAGEGLREALLVPLRNGDEVIGVVQVADRLGAMSAFTRDDLRLLQTLAAHGEATWRNGRLLEQLRHDASHDGLTGLANRTLFLARLQERLAALRPCGEATAEAALLLLDLDRFKEVNDSLGHPIGDVLLGQVADRLRRSLAGETLVARLGGDEFAVLLPHCASVEEARDVARETRSVLTGPYEVEGVSLEVGASIGIALIPQDGREPAAVLQHADVAMYTAKRAGTGVAAYDSGEDASSLHRLRLAGELRGAIEGGHLVLHYQPQLGLGTRTVVGYEALVRWQHPERGLLMPDEFVPIAEQTGLIGLLTREVLRQALEQCRGWLPDSPDTGVAVNLSARGLLEAGLLRTVTELLDATGVPARLLTLEITESSVITDLDSALAALQQLHACGIRLSVDDFGTGYSSLSYLQRLPVQEVKVDKCFVMPMSHDPRAATIVRAIIELAHNLGLTVVAEGVEDDLAQRALLTMGCDTIQGYLLSRPLSPDVLAQWRTAHGGQCPTVRSGLPRLRAL